MAASRSPRTAATRPRARKSIAHMPSSDMGGDKENLTVDSAAMSSFAAPDKNALKKTRSKSIGPGGLDALRDDTGNRRGSALPPHIKSILKPTIALSPPKQIPAHASARKSSPRKLNNGTMPGNCEEGSLIDTSIPDSAANLLGVYTLPNPFEGPLEAREEQSCSSSPTQRQIRIAVRTEEEQQAAAKERERQELLAHKDARRKSLANRRVSFAPEATLHTWDTVEMPEDSTTSSANSTRRASAVSANAVSHMPGSDASEPPSTPPEQVEEVQVSASPGHQRDLHQKKRRRSSGIPPMNFNNPDEFSSSPYSGGSVNSDDTGSHAFLTADENVDSSDSDDKDIVEDEATVTGVDMEDITAQSAVSTKSNGSTSSSGRLEEALREAARQAGTQGIDYDENGDITMEMADDEITAAFKPWMKKGKYVPKVVGDLSALQDQENLNPFSPAFKANLRGKIELDESEKTMDFTQAAGTILSAPEELQGSPEQGHRKSGVSGKRRSSVARRRSSGDGSGFGDETMDLTTVIGGIQRKEELPGLFEETGALGSADEDEELTMEFTAVIGGVVGRNDQLEFQGKSLTNDQLTNQQLLSDGEHKENEDNSFNGEDMDITFAAGGILPSITERTEPAEDRTLEMDITTAVGAILPKQLSTTDKNQAKFLMEVETDTGQLSGSPFDSEFLQSHADSALPIDPRLSNHFVTTASETGSPSLATSLSRGNARKSMESRRSTTPKSSSRRSTPMKKPTTPSKQLTPNLMRPTTSGKTPPSRNVAMRTSSPKKLFKAEIRDAVSTPKPAIANSIFQNHPTTGVVTPSVVLKPGRRRSSGLGIDKEGLGSPRVTELLDRRRSIGERATKFVPYGRAPVVVHFDDPQAMEQELDKERKEDERRESGRGTLQMEADARDLGEEKDVTANLKDMIESLTPQKKRLNGRKSLHVGAAKGLLGKRPAELDEEEEDEDRTPKRFKGREGSPVKKVKLPAPPSKSQTIGRITRSTRANLAETTGNVEISTPSLHVSPSKHAFLATPSDQSRFKDAEAGLNPVKLPLSFEQKLDAATVAVAGPLEEEDRMHLQEFLNLTSIRFMELTTTKRRHTVAPNGMLENSARKADQGKVDTLQADSGFELENCVVAGACTVPMLELYQHSCRELKKYIAEGRSIVGEIEADTFEENPPLFREYISAAPEVKSIMDNQFKNVKTHARLLSKAMWYEWRMKLFDGLKDGLLSISEGMDQDHEKLTEQERLLHPILPDLIEEHESLEQEHRTLQVQADELASCDQEELKDARNALLAVEESIDAKQRMIQDLQNQLLEKEDHLENAIERKQECLEETKEAEKVRQESRGWTSAEVAALQFSANALEKTHGWTITSASGPTLTMTYKRTLQLFFTPASFVANADNSPISLTYIADAHEYHPQLLTTERRFFLQIMRVQLQCLQQSRTSVKDLLNFVSSNWQKVCAIVEEARILGVSYITESTITSDEVMAVHSILLLRSMRTKIDVSFEVKVQNGEGLAALDVAVKSNAKVVYGEGLKENKMTGFLEQRVAEKNLLDRERGLWARAVAELEEKLLSKGKK